MRENIFVIEIANEFEFNFSLFIYHEFMIYLLANLFLGGAV
jgi:hypothetical protein